jgi:hypothetical protein
MTSQELLLKLQQEPDTALKFAIDNNPTAVITALATAGFTGDGSRMYAYETLKALMENGKKEMVIKLISSIPYINSAPNYTGGLRDYFVRSSPPNSAPKQPYVIGSKFSWDGLLAGLGMGLSAYVATTQIANTQQGNNNNNADTCDKDKDYKDCCADDKECIEKAKTTRMWIIIGIVGGSLLIIGIIAFALTRGGKEEKKKD